jgi:SAM-dependent methyltransferase
MVRQVRHIQFSYLDEKQDTTKNYADEAAAKLEELLDLPFRNIHVQTTEGDLQVQFTKRGRAIVHQHDAPERREPPSLQHDRRKELPLPADRPDPFLQQIGIMTQEGTVRASMRSKYQQINRFLELVIDTAELGSVDHSPLRVVDCGCGSAYLTFAVYHYLNHILGLPTRVTGIDVNEDLIARRSGQSRDLGWDGLSFQVSRIIDYKPDVAPDIVLALHACDTATDEALAQAVRWGSARIYSVPCCHHHLQQQMSRRTAPTPLAPLLRHGILKQRLGDLLTDTLRALVLRALGYRTDVIEFISTEHTDKNLMIRAVRSGRPGNHRAMRDTLGATREYLDLVEAWQVRPYLGQLLGKELSDLMGEGTDAD